MADTQAALEKAQDRFRRSTPAARCSSIKDAAKFCGDDMALIADAGLTSCDGSVCQPGIGGDKDTRCVKGPLFNPLPHRPPPPLGQLFCSSRCRHQLHVALSSQRISTVTVWRCNLSHYAGSALSSCVVHDSGQGGEAEFRNRKLGNDQADQIRRRQHDGSSCGERAPAIAALTTAPSDAARMVLRLSWFPDLPTPHVPAPCHPPACDTRVMLSGVVWLQLPIVIGGGAVALLVVVGLAAFCMHKSSMESGADNVQPVEGGGGRGGACKAGAVACVARMARTGRRRVTTSPIHRRLRCVPRLRHPHVLSLPLSLPLWSPLDHRRQ